MPNEHSSVRGRGRYLLDSYCQGQSPTKLSVLDCQISFMSSFAVQL